MLHRRWFAFLALAVLAPLPVDAARRERLELRSETLELPGAPSSILAADLNGDGRQDLVISVAITEWDQMGIEETTEMDDIDGLVEVLTIVPFLLDRRELHVFLGREGGGYQATAPLPLERSILSLDNGPPEMPIVALTDDGLAALRIDGEGESAAPRFEPMVEERPILAHTSNFVNDLGLDHDLDGDGRIDLLLPTASGAAVYLSTPDGLTRQPHLVWPTPQSTAKRRLVLHHPLPRVRDVDGDGLPDLLLPDADDGWRRFHVLLGRGSGRFETPFAPLGDELPATSRDEEGGDIGSVVYFGDLDGDRTSEYVIQSDLAEDGGMRQEMRQAKQPPFRYSFHRALDDLSIAPEPYQEFEATGYAFDGDEEVRVPGGFQDLDGNGRLDLVTLTLDFSMMQAVRILATKRISIGLDFHVWCQQDDGRFRAVPGLDLSGRFRLDLNNLQIGHLSQFAGDFDGDGKADFVQMGRGRQVTIHRGRDGCAYPSKPDLTLRLREEPRDLKLVQVRDLDADGFSDLLVIQPQKIKEVGVTPPVRLDLYLSGDGS